MRTQPLEHLPVTETFAPKESVPTLVLPELQESRTFRVLAVT